MQTNSRNAGRNIVRQYLLDIATKELAVGFGWFSREGHLSVDRTIAVILIALTVRGQMDNGTNFAGGPIILLARRG
ncbi:MAG: hypothetical protein CMJ81_11165 [Planctomycetaceae bacterium]|nr:hypothetical protein [Planctomycetaceae bacterium]MBP63659.1 hypothetical protein [Planctomycetaceae bacterium]